MANIVRLTESDLIRLVKRVISEQTTPTTIDSSYAFETFYNKGYKKFGSEVQGTWYQKEMTFDNVKISPINLTTMPRSQSNVKMKLEMGKTPLQKFIDDGEEIDMSKYNPQKIQNYKMLVYNVYDSQNKIIITFEPREQRNYIVNNSGTLVSWDTYQKDIRTK